MKAYFLLATLAVSGATAQSVEVSKELEKARQQLANQSVHLKPAKPVAPKIAKAPTPPPPQKIEVYIHRAQLQTQKMIKARLKAIRKLANSTQSQHEKNISGFVLSTDIADFPDTPPKVSEQIAMIKEDMVMLFRLVALDIEMQRGYGAGVLTLDDKVNLIYRPNAKLPAQLNDKRERLLSVNLSNNVTIRSINMAIDCMLALNAALVEEAQLTEDNDEARQLYITQAVYMYEMTEVVMTLLEQLTFDTKIIATQYVAHKATIEQRIATIDRQIAKAQVLFEKGHLSMENAQQQTLTAARVKVLNKRRLEQWQAVIGTLEKQLMFIRHAKSSKEILQYNREQAKLQLETLRELMQLSDLKSALQALEQLTQTGKSLELMIFDEKTVRSLLGYSENL